MDIVNNLYVILSFLIGFLLAGFLAACFWTDIFKRIKIDYSIEAKNNYRKEMCGEYALYVRTSIFSKWKQKHTYAGVNEAIADGNYYQKYKLPKYF